MKDWLSKRKIKASQFVFLVGAMKSGTSSLTRAMMCHADIATGRAKEPQYFAAKKAEIGTASQYLANWTLKDHLRTRYLLDASTSYSKYPSFGDSAQMIADATANAKIIYIMRDPIKRIESQIAHNIAIGRLSLEEYHRRDEQGFYHHYLLTSSYAAQLKQYGARFPRPDMLLLSFEDMLASPNNTLMQIWKFLELKPLHGEAEFDRRNTRCSIREEFGGPILPDAMQSYLREALSDDMAALRRDWGVDTKRWGFT